MITILILLIYKFTKFLGLGSGFLFWLRTDGVNTNVAAAKVMTLAGLGKKVRPGTFGKIEVS